MFEPLRKFFDYNVPATSKVNWKQRFTYQGTSSVLNDFTVYFCYDNDKQSVEFDNILKGKEFLKKVRWYYINNHNADLVAITINGTKSNVGLNYKNFCQGDNPWNKRDFKKLCKMHDVRILYNDKE